MHSERALRHSLGPSALLLALTIGCAPGVGNEGSPPSQRLAEVEIPQGFDFATQQAVSLLAADSAFDWRAALVEVALPSGERIYSGPLFASRAVRLPLSTWVEHLEVTVRAPDLERSSRVPVRDGQALVVVD